MPASLEKYLHYFTPGGLLLELFPNEIADLLPFLAEYYPKFTNYKLHWQCHGGCSWEFASSPLK